MLPAYGPNFAEVAPTISELGRPGLDHIMSRIVYAGWMSSLNQCFPKLFARGPLLASKITKNPHVHADVYKECPDEWYLKLKICILEVILDCYEYIPITYLLVHCMILP